MTAQLHFTQIDIDQEITSRIQTISDELTELRAAGELKIKITSSTLFYLEALGYMVDFSTGMVTKDVPSTCQATPIATSR
ncbi:hypothetical protein KC906_02670 [Candidatus Kaiserbacteria bacterium]|nr:hypothetical protein [Candidatus Kaiserbacteria bacterium]